MKPKLVLALLAIPLGLYLTACQAQPAPTSSYDPADLRFSGERALEAETEFVARFPDRHSGQPNNQLAAEWLEEQFIQSGWECSIDKWEIINYSQPVGLNNVVCRLPGDSEREILVTAHLDQASTTVEGADNDASGIAILLQLAEIFAAETDRPYSLAFVATDAEEYGMIGAGRYIQTHPNPENIIANISLDNLGREYYDGMNMELIGRYKGYGPIWLALLARDAARAGQANGITWEVNLRAPFDQVTDQAAPASFMDQGPGVAAGVPSLGFAAHVPAEFADLHYQLWHDPGDTMEHQSAGALGQSGLIAEALIRQLLSMESFPTESGPYLYFDGSGQALRGLPLWLIFIAIVGLFLLASVLVDRRPLAAKLSSWRTALPHFLGLWLPLVASIVLLYVFVAVGLMDYYEEYPATTKDPALLNPRWPAVILFVIGLGVFLFIGRRLAGRLAGDRERPGFSQIKSFAMLVIGLGGIYVLTINPFGLLFCLPLFFWLLIRGRKRFGRALDILFFLLGGLIVYALIYVFGFLTLRYDWLFLWYMLNMFSTQMITFPTAAVAMAMIAAGLAMIVSPVEGREAGG